MKREITTSHTLTLIAIITFSAVLHSVYALIGSNTDAWWAFEIAVDRLVVISLLLIISNLIQSKTLTLVARLTAGYYAVMLTYELIFIFNQTITVCYYQMLVSLYLLISLTIIIFHYVTSNR